VQSTTTLGTPEVPSSKDTEEVTLETLIDRANAFMFYYLAYDALRDHGVDFAKLPQFENLTDLYARDEITSAVYFKLMAEAVREAVAKRPFVRKPTVSDVGNA
jgi:hypothetical protein